MNNKQIISGLLSLFFLASCHSYEYHSAAPCHHAAPPPARPIPAPRGYHKASPKRSMKQGPHHAERIHHHNGAPLPHPIPQHR